MANSVDSDEVAHYEPPHLDLRCLQFSIFSFGALEKKSNHRDLNHADMSKRILIIYSGLSLQ